MTLKQRPDSHKQHPRSYCTAVIQRYPNPILKMWHAKLWQEWQFSVISEICETKLLQHSQGEDDPYFPTLWTL